MRTSDDLVAEVEWRKENQSRQNSIVLRLRGYSMKELCSRLRVGPWQISKRSSLCLVSMNWALPILLSQFLVMHLHSGLVDEFV